MLKGATRQSTLCAIPKPEKIRKVVLGSASGVKSVQNSNVQITPPDWSRPAWRQVMMKKKNEDN